MEREFCHARASEPDTLASVHHKGIRVCETCYEAIDANRHEPYSKIVGRLAIAEAGYYVNRKIATIKRRLRLAGIQVRRRSTQLWSPLHHGPDYGFRNRL
ncbi:MAG: hypothetical protein R6U93_02690 [Dehalococcoidia bacterium]